jgi:hypothetical protein
MFCIRNADPDPDPAANCYNVYARSRKLVKSAKKNRKCSVHISLNFFILTEVRFLGKNFVVPGEISLFFGDYRYFVKFCHRYSDIFIYFDEI